MDDTEPPREPGEYKFAEAPAARLLREAALALPDEPRLHIVSESGKSASEQAGKEGRKVKTSVYLERRDVDRLAWLAEVEERPQAEIIRDAIRSYWPRPNERTFLFFDTGEGDGRSVADIPDEELFAGMGSDAWGDEARGVGDRDR